MRETEVKVAAIIDEVMGKMSRGLWVQNEEKQKKNSMTWKKCARLENFKSKGGSVTHVAGVHKVDDLSTVEANNENSKRGKWGEEANNELEEAVAAEQPCRAL